MIKLVLVVNVVRVIVFGSRPVFGQGLGLVPDFVPLQQVGWHFHCGGEGAVTGVGEVAHDEEAARVVGQDLPVLVHDDHRLDTGVFVL
jgi:hypothetical protein